MKWPLDPKDVTTRYITESTLLCEGPCLLVSGAITAIEDFATVTLYDGGGTNGELKAVVGSYYYQTTPYAPPVPIYCAQGLYASVDTNNYGATVQFAKLQQGE